MGSQSKMFVCIYENCKIINWTGDGHNGVSKYQLIILNATWLILPVVVCLSRRLSHACKVQAPICEGETANGSLNQS